MFVYFVEHCRDNQSDSKKTSKTNTNNDFSFCILSKKTFNLSVTTLENFINLKGLLFTHCFINNFLSQVSLS